MSPLRALTLGLLLVTPAAADEAKAPPKEDKAWKTLCDGKTLDGWKPAGYVGEGKVHVKDGAIVLEKGKRMTGVTYARDDFPKTDYEFTLEGKRVEGRDFFCTATFPVGDSFCSFVVGGWGGNVVGLSSINGADASENETYKSMEFKSDQWYRVRVRVTPKRIEAWIDKEKMVDLDTKDLRIGIRIECERCKPFGIATWDTTGAVRDIRVRKLSEAERK
jgi:hypothetical protein